MDYSKIAALNFSSLKHVQDSPLHYWHREQHPSDDDTPSKRLGRATHCLTLEPDAFESRYVVGQGKRCTAMTKKGDRCSHQALPLADHCGVHDGQAEAAVWLLDHPGVEVLTADEGDTAVACRNAVAGHSDAARLLHGAPSREVVVQWTDADTGVACKGRLDAVGPSSVVDLKTTGKGLGNFGRDAGSLLYHAQVAWYLDGARAAGVVSDSAGAYIIAVETAAPWDVAAFEVAGAELDAGRELYRRMIDTWVSCRETGDWYGRYPVLTRLELPRWAPGMATGEDL